MEESLWISVFVASELSAGVQLSTQPRQERDAVRELIGGLQLTYPDSRFPAAYGRLFADLRRSGETVAAMDLLIAVSALLEGARLVTRNTADFARIPGLDLLTY